MHVFCFFNHRFFCYIFSISLTLVLTFPIHQIFFFISFSTIILPVSKDELKVHNINPVTLLDSRDELAIRKFWNFPSGIIHFPPCCSSIAVLSDAAACSFVDDCKDMERSIEGAGSLHYQLHVYNTEEQRNSHKLYLHDRHWCQTGLCAVLIAPFPLYKWLHHCRLFCKHRHVKMMTDCSLTDVRLNKWLSGTVKTLLRWTGSKA